MTSVERYEQELKQSDVDHHTPTAGAMTGHIIANLLIHSLKIGQAKLFAQGPAALFLAQYGSQWVGHEQTVFADLNRLLVNNGESIPTTTDQFKQFTMLEEDGAASTTRAMTSSSASSRISTPRSCSSPRPSP